MKRSRSTATARGPDARCRASAVVLTAIAATACADAPRTHDYTTEVVTADELLQMEPTVEFLDIRSTVSVPGGTWVLDSDEPYLTFIADDAAGTVTRFGPEGDGPGELRQPVAMQATATGLDVWDVGREEVVSFDQTGHVLAIRRLSSERGGWIRPDMAEVSYLDPWRVRRLADHVVYARFPEGLTHPGEAASGALVASIDELGLGETIVEYRGLVPTGRDAQSQFAAVPLWDACDDQLVVWDPRRSEVRWHDARGQDLATIPVEIQSPPITEDGVVRFLRHMARLEIGPDFESAGIDFSAMAADLKSDFGERGPAITDVRCAAPDVAWLQLFDMSEDPLGHGSTWIRVGGDTPPEAVVFPEHFRPIEFGIDVLLGSDEGISGQTLSQWRVPGRRTT